MCYLNTIIVSKAFWIAIAISNFVVALAILGLHWSSVNHQKFAESFYSVEGGKLLLDLDSTCICLLDPSK